MAFYLGCAGRISFVRKERTGAWSYGVLMADKVHWGIANQQVLARINPDDLGRAEVGRVYFLNDKPSPIFNEDGQGKSLLGYGELVVSPRQKSFVGRCVDALRGIVACGWIGNRNS